MANAMYACISRSGFRSQDLKIPDTKNPGDKAYGTIEAVQQRKSPELTMPYPGATVSSYCELMVELGSPDKPTDWPTLTDRASSETATMFALLWLGYSLKCDAGHRCRKSGMESC